MTVGPGVVVPVVGAGRSRTGAKRVWAAGRLAWTVAREPRRFADVPAWWRARSAPPAAVRVPWWPAAAVSRVRAHLSETSVVFEYGGGGSTWWLHGLGATVTTVEHDRNWYERLRVEVPGAVTLLLREPGRGGSVGSAVEAGSFDAYVAAIADYPDDSFDLVIVDGRARVACGLAAMAKVRVGGLLLLDDSQRTRYAPLARALTGWPRTDVRGLKPGEVEISQTTIWTKPHI